MKRILVFPMVLALVGVVWASGISQTQQQPNKPQKKTISGDTRKISYTKEIKPILSTNCFTCHGPDSENRKARLRLDTSEGATKRLRSGFTPIVPGHPEKSDLVERIYSKFDDELMPPPESNHTLKESEKVLLKQWIAQGAEYEEHWAFDAPKRPAVPNPKNAKWANNPIDRFILAKMQKAGLNPSPEADRYTLARRVALDLNGLPPPMEMVDRFVNDKRPKAYERYVDELMGLPAFGERWAVVWLDLARYADSNGYANDNPRTIWRYRDWVIEAINKNMPFDQFTIEQLAGDMLSNPTKDQLIATAFHRNTLSNDEGGTDNEEFRVAAVVDRTNTTFQVWMGMTMACAQCHNHKYDPLSQEEYFQVFAIFNNTEDNDAGDNRPNLVEFTAKQKTQRQKLQQRIATLEGQAKKDKKKAKEIRGQITKLNKQVSRIRGIPTPIMRELPANRRRKTHILVRGNFLNKGKQVQPGVPELFHDLPKDKAVNRMTLARWLVDEKNPLTARVAVNRYWEHIFGQGLVTSSEDFGVRGKLPTHPKLLDWLAVEFMKPTKQTGEAKTPTPWDVRRLLKLIVTSATYRQSSRMTSAILNADPTNDYYARGPRFRVPAEAIRDQALFVSGLLSNKMYGPPVRPPRPKLGLRAAFGGGTDWQTSQGADRYRRAIYTKWRRTTPYPSMTTFDAPDRNVCSVKRPRTNTPLQALVVLNDPVYVEAAQALGRRMMKAEGKTIREKLHHGFRLALVRPPQKKETERLVQLYERAKSAFAENPKDAVAMATEPLGALPQGTDAVEAAAFTVVGNVLLNLDEMVLKR
ncbi:MAG: PSD1 and planctomycete cytochrome C domain-containing protein [Gemmataceae bacterium]